MYIRKHFFNFCKIFLLLVTHFSLSVFVFQQLIKPKQLNFMEYGNRKFILKTENLLFSFFLLTPKCTSKTICCLTVSFYDLFICQMLYPVELLCYSLCAQKLLKTIFCKDFFLLGSLTSQVNKFLFKFRPHYHRTLGSTEKK